MSFTRWTDIEGFHNIRKAIAKYEHLDPGCPITYRAKIKLHGTNAGIVVKPNGDVFAQSRSAIIGTGNDNCGFAAWVENTKNVWQNVASSIKITIFGEFCGHGIQKGVAITQVGGKQFAIFAIQYGDYDEDGNAKMIVDADSIINFFNIRHIALPKNVHILPWYGDELIIDFSDKSLLEKAVEDMNIIVDDVEAVDPWVKEVFDVEGIGEGVVYYPVSFTTDDDTINRRHLSAYMFKAKGIKHKVQKDRQAVILDSEVVASVNEFADKFVTEQRLEQWATSVNRGVLDFDVKLIGAFLKEFNQDVKKESGDELTVAELEWKEVAKEVAKRAREWYLAKLQEI